MKIAFVSLMFGSPWGGSEELWHRTAKLAISKGHTIFTLTQKFPKMHTKLLELKSLGAYPHFYYLSERSILQRILLKLKFNVKTGHIIPDLTADIYVISNGTTYDFLVIHGVMDKILVTGKPFILISQHSFENGFVVNNLQREYGIDVIKKALKFFFVSERNLYAAERQIAFPIKNAEVISNPLNIRHLSIKKFPISEKLLMACVARFDCKSKAQDVLLEALSSERWKNRDFCLRLFGQGIHMEYIKQLILMYNLKEKVIIEGHVDNVDKIWESNQILILPSLNEGTPLSLVEAMLSGRTALATDVGGNDKYILNGITGFLACSASMRSLMESLEDVWNNKESLKSMGERAFFHAKNITNLYPEVTLLQDIEKVS